MNEDYLTKLNYDKKVVEVKGANFIALTRSADAFICAAGFESRADRVPLAAAIVKNPIIVKFKNGPPENEKTFNKFTAKFAKLPGYDVCELDWARVERFEVDFERSLKKLQNITTGRIILDISALPNFAICVAVMKIRQVLPTANLILFYTEAEEYFPQKRDFERIKRAAKKQSADLFPEYLSSRAVSMFMPAMFSGVTLGHNDTCLLVYAGYEPHRTNCAIEATNPCKLVMIYGEPERPDLKWRLDLSKIMHVRADEQLKKTEAVSSTSNISDNLKLLLEYYDYLYDDHVICVCPINSKMQAVASALAWETYPDIQLNFPIPAEYLAGRFSVKSRDTFIIDLGFPPAVRRFLH
jgi:hypothetical protein